MENLAVFWETASLSKISVTIGRVRYPWKILIFSNNVIGISKFQNSGKFDGLAEVEAKDYSLVGCNARQSNRKYQEKHVLSLYPFSTLSNGQFRFLQQDGENSTRNYDVRYQEAVDLLTEGDAPINLMRHGSVPVKLATLPHQHNSYVSRGFFFY